MKEIEIKKVQLSKGAKVRRPYITDGGVRYTTYAFQTLKLQGVFYEVDGLLVLSEVQFLKDKEVKNNESKHTISDIQ